MVKNEIVCSFHDIPITCRLQIKFFFSQSELNMCHVYITQSSLKRLFHVARDLSSEREFRCGLSQFHCRNEVKQGHIRYKQTNCRPDYILERIENWCRFWKLCCFVLRTSVDPNVYIGEASSNNAPEGQDKSFFIHGWKKWYVTFHLMYIKHLCITVGLQIA